MASASNSDVWGWISSLPPFQQWSTNTTSYCLCAWTSSQSSLKVSITKNLNSYSPRVTFSILADLNISIALWNSSSFHLKNKNQQSLDEETIVHLFCNVINGVLKYGPGKTLSFRFPAVQIGKNFRDMFNLAFRTLTFLVCVYEAPHDLRTGCLDALAHQLARSESRDASKLLVRVLGSNLEEQWMRSFSLAITNWIMELQASNQYSLRSPSPLFSYAFSATGLWKVQLYCPTIAMSLQDPSATTQDEQLLFSLKYQQLEGVIQLAYKVIIRESWIDVVINVDNIRCDVIPLVSETLMAERGYGPEEKHFPSRISLQITPILQSDVLSVSASKSSDNPTHEFGLEKGIEGSFDPPSSLGLKVAATETITMSMKPWKFEQSVYGDTASLNWFLHDGVDGKEVFSSRPSKLELLQPRAWFKDRYSSAYRPFTKQGGVIFAGDEYGESVRWKVCEGALGTTMEWEIKGRIWLTYWPNKRRTFYTETRSLEFKELLYLPLQKLK